MCAIIQDWTAYLKFSLRVVNLTHERRIRVAITTAVYSSPRIKLVNVGCSESNQIWLSIKRGELLPGGRSRKYRALTSPLEPAGRRAGARLRQNYPSIMALPGCKTSARVRMINRGTLGTWRAQLTCTVRGSVDSRDRSVFRPIGSPLQSGTRFPTPSSFLPRFIIPRPFLADLSLSSRLAVAEHTSTPAADSRGEVSARLDARVRKREIRTRSTTDELLSLLFFKLIYINCRVTLRRAISARVIPHLRPRRNKF